MAVCMYLIVLVVYQDACRYFLMESGFALFVALLINIAVVSVSGTVCSYKNLSQDDADKCNNLTLNSASFLLKVCVSLVLFDTIGSDLNKKFLIFCIDRMCLGNQAQLCMQ